MIKQIYDGDPVKSVVERGGGYFEWLMERSGISGPLFSLLVNEPFNRLESDENLKRKAKEDIRQMYAFEVTERFALEDFCKNLSATEEKLVKSIRGECSVLEVVLCLAVSLNDMFEASDDDQINYFFELMMHNLGLDVYDDEDYDMHEESVKKYWQVRISDLNHKTDLKTDLKFGLFSDLKPTENLWKQMNDFADEHTNEEGEFVG